MLIQERAKRTQDLNSKSVQKRIRKQVFDICREWERLNKKSEKEHKSYIYDKLCQHLKNNEFETTYKISKFCIWCLVKELDFANLNSFKLLYDYKISEMQEMQDVADQMEQEYHTGVMDPVRLVAKIERQAAIKKNVGAKKKINDIFKKFEKTHDDI